jgi:hypothetical protein
MSERVLIFKNPLEDFAKIFLPTLLVFVIFYFPQIYTSTFAIMATIYLFDGGHVYSTMLEQYADPIERKKAYVWQLTLLAFAMNFVVAFFYESYFFTYIFYFTVFHNMRQGLGVTFLYRRGVPMMSKFVKYSYYFLTMVPFVLFHLKERPENKMGEAIIQPLNLGQSHHWEALLPFYHYGLLFFIAGVVLIYATLLWKKQTRGLLAMGFFALVYTFAFIISKNEFQSYMVLIFSHAIPYFWLMEKRLVNTHSSGSMKKFAVIFLFLIFLTGGMIDYSHKYLLDFFDDINLLVLAILYTPLISHFLFDGVIWTRDNERFQVFLKS